MDARGLEQVDPARAVVVLAGLPARAVALARSMQAEATRQALRTATAAPAAHRALAQPARVHRGLTHGVAHPHPTTGDHRRRGDRVGTRRLAARFPIPIRGRIGNGGCSAWSTERATRGHRCGAGRHADGRARTERLVSRSATAARRGKPHRRTGPATSKNHERAPPERRQRGEGCPAQLCYRRGRDELRVRAGP